MDRYDPYTDKFIRDTIDRQQAIDALDEQIEQCDKALSSFDISMRDEYAVKAERASLVAFREILEYLPPAQLSTNLAEVGTDCISREQAIDGLNDAVHEHNITDFDAVATILALPSVTPKQRTGKWIDGIIPNDGGGLPVIVCDQCNTFFPLQFGDGHNFCPNCGADMRGGENDGCSQVFEREESDV